MIIDFPFIVIVGEVSDADVNGYYCVKIFDALIAQHQFSLRSIQGSSHVIKTKANSAIPLVQQCLTGGFGLHLHLWVAVEVVI